MMLTELFRSPLHIQIIHVYLACHPGPSWLMYVSLITAKLGWRTPMSWCDMLYVLQASNISSNLYSARGHFRALKAQIWILNPTYLKCWLNEWIMFSTTMYITTYTQSLENRLTFLNGVFCDMFQILMIKYDPAGVTWPWHWVPAEANEFMVRFFWDWVYINWKWRA